MDVKNVVERVNELDEEIEKAISEISRLKWEKTQLIIAMANSNSTKETGTV